jgi:kynurenine formamidase
MEDHDKLCFEIWDRVSNKGRWGNSDEKGTLNYITDEKRRQAAGLVKVGKAISIAKPLDFTTSIKNPIPAVHYMLYDQVNPVSALDWVGVAPHGFCVTHLDCVAHVNWEGNMYNGRKSSDVITSGGLKFGSIDKLRDGVFTRGVFLDVCAVRGVKYLAVEEYVTIEDLEAAEKLSGVRVEPGDAIFVRVGFGPREDAEGLTDAAKGVPGIHAEVLSWVHERQVAVWSGDCVERMPYPSKRFPLPMHMIGLGAMGLIQLDIPDCEILARACREHGRNEFLLTCAPLFIPGGTGSPINPVVVF